MLKVETILRCTIVSRALFRFSRFSRCARRESQRAVCFHDFAGELVVAWRFLGEKYHSERMWLGVRCVFAKVSQLLESPSKCKRRSVRNHKKSLLQALSTRKFQLESFKWSASDFGRKFSTNSASDYSQSILVNHPLVQSTYDHSIGESLCIMLGIVATHDFLSVNFTM